MKCDWRGGGQAEYVSKNLNMPLVSKNKWTLDFPAFQWKLDSISNEPSIVPEWLGKHGVVMNGASTSAVTCGNA
jgi:hypothetical protein